MAALASRVLAVSSPAASLADSRGSISIVAL